MSTKDGFPSSLAGGCLCRRVRYRVDGAPKFIFACHCTDCQHATASAFSLGMALDESQLTVTDGKPREWQKIGSSGKPSISYTCPDCASWTHTRPDSQPGMVVVRPISLDEHRWVRALAQIFTRSALPWALLPVQFSYEEEFSDPAPIAKAFACGGIHP